MVLASARARRPGAFGAEACVKGPVASSSCTKVHSSSRHPFLGSGRRSRGSTSAHGCAPLPILRLASVRPRFLADCNVGRLARWLRALGYDASYHARIDDSELVREAA
ncbi:MAG TPA: Mut7-C RNAse domain-containing protein, partial [Candidatus Dormibacteraeota bacterium]|nr:Mut7-C RNAse domain-containing protein [Candidatus Dormibacteraeota bacterium]